jgi:hypothetical protein
MVGKAVSEPNAVTSREALLQLMCFGGAPIVRLAFDFDIGTSGSTTVSYRFDDKPGHSNVKAKLVGRGIKVILIADRATVAQFADELATSEVLYVNIASLTKGRTNIDFPVANAEPAIEASYAACPIDRAKLGAPATAKR